MLFRKWTPGEVSAMWMAFPLGWLPGPSYEHLLALVRMPLAKIYLFVLCSLPLFHWAQHSIYRLVVCGLGGRLLSARRLPSSMQPQKDSDDSDRPGQPSNPLDA